MEDSVLRPYRLAYGVLVMLCLGLLYGWSIFAAPLEAEFGWSRSETSWTFTLSMSAFCAGGFLGGIITRRSRPRFAIALAAVLLLSGFGLASRLNSLWGLYIFYGIISSLGVGIGYNVFISVVNSWFPDKAGFAAGCMLMGFGCGGMFLGILANALIASVGWRSTFMGLGAAFCVLLLLGIPFMKYPSEYPEIDAAALSADKRIQGTRQYTPAAMLGTGAFRIYFVWAVLMPIGGLMVIGNASTIGGEVMGDAISQTLCVSVVSVANGCGRVLFGSLYDRIGRRRCMLLLSVMAVASGGVLFAAYGVARTAVLLLALILVGLVYGGVPSVSTSVLQEFFGLEYFSLNSAVLNISLVVASFTSSPVSSGLHGSFGSYMPISIVMAVLGAVSVIGALLLKKPAAENVRAD